MISGNLQKSLHYLIEPWGKQFLCWRDKKMAEVNVMEIQKLLVQKDQVSEAIDKVEGKIRLKEKELDHWSNASDSESSRMAVGFIEMALDELKEEKAALRRNETTLRTNLEQLKIQLEFSISQSTDKQYIVRARELRARL